MTVSDSATPVLSSRLEQFRYDLGRDKTAACAALRADLEAAGGPLIEPWPDGNVLVTFVFEAEGAEHVRLSCELWPGGGLSGQSLSRIADTDFWFASVVADPRVSVAYEYRVDPPVLPEGDVVAFLADMERAAPFFIGMVMAARHDPYNKIFLPGHPFLNPKSHVLNLPSSEALPYNSDADLAGEMRTATMSTPSTPGDREVHLYLPPGFRPGERLPLVILLDGELLVAGKLQALLDQAIQCGDLPPMVAVFWSNLSPTSRMTEYACDPALPTALADELLPWLEDQGIQASLDPEQTVVAGSSFSALGAGWVALERPQTFGSVLMMSPSLWFEGPRAASGEPVAQFLTQEYATREEVPGRMFLSVGTLETDQAWGDAANPVSMIQVARSMRDVARDRGIAVDYYEVPGGHDALNARLVFVRGLRALINGSAT